MRPLRSLMISILVAFLAAAAAENNVTRASPWLKRARRQRDPGCWLQPWICLDKYPPFRQRLCCKNRCVDMGSDENNCGFCGIRCPFMWRCCKGICIDTSVNPFHCGQCFNKCPFGVLCFYGMCGYAQPLPPFPFPFPPKHPKPLPPQLPPFPFPPKHPKPLPPLLPFPPKIPEPQPPPPEGFRPKTTLQAPGLPRRLNA